MTNRNDTPLVTRRRAWLAAAAVLALSMGAASQAHAVPACKTDVFVKNEQSASIKVLRFFYSSTEKGRAKRWSTSVSRRVRPRNGRTRR